MFFFFPRSRWGVGRVQNPKSSKYGHFVLFFIEDFEGPAILGNTLLCLWIDEMCQSKSMGPDSVIPQPINP
jgi:hypothetical protein